jgi:hypothetical protein
MKSIPDVLPLMYTKLGITTENAPGKETPFGDVSNTISEV